VDFCRPPAARAADRLAESPPFSTRSAAVSLNRRGVDQHPRGARLITAGVPFTTPGATNSVCVVKILTEAKIAA